MKMDKSSRMQNPLKLEFGETKIVSTMGSRKVRKRSRSRSKKRTTYPHLESIANMERHLPKFENSKVIVKDFGKIKAFGVNTHQGTVRSYNEDRVSILLNAQ